MPNSSLSGPSYEPGREPDGWVAPAEAVSPVPEAAAEPVAASEAAEESEVPAETEPEPDPSDLEPTPPPQSAPKAEHVEYAAAVLDVPLKEAEGMTKPELVELAKKAAPTLTSPDGG